MAERKQQQIVQVFKDHAFTPSPAGQLEEYLNTHPDQRVVAMAGDASNYLVVVLELVPTLRGMA